MSALRWKEDSFSTGLPAKFTAEALKKARSISLFCQLSYICRVESPDWGFYAKLEGEDSSALSDVLHENFDDQIIFVFSAF